jgi:hypothetical protein
MTCSYYADIHDRTGTLREVVHILDGIRNGEWAAPVAELRGLIAAGDERAQAAKLNLPAAAFSGQFSERRKSACKKRTGLVVLDYDDLERPADVRQSVQASPHVVAAFLSCSGNGLKVLVAVDVLALHEPCWRAAVAHLRDTVGLEADPSGKDVSRLCFVSHDPEAFIRMDAEPLDVEPVPEPVREPFRPSVQPGTGALTPGDDFDLRGDFAGLLQRHGWTPARGAGNWTRPGKTSGISATYGKVRGVDGGPRFFIFSSSVNTLRPNHTYRPWQVYAELEHGGDYAAAASALRRAGFGGTAPRSAPVPSQHSPEEQEPVYADGTEGSAEPVFADGTEPSESTASRMLIPIPSILSMEEFEACDIEQPQVLVEGLVHRATIVSIAGASKSRKSWLMMHLGLSAAAGVPWLGFATAGCGVLYLNMELLPYHARERVQWIREQVTPRKDLPFYIWNLRGINPTLEQLSEQAIAVCRSHDIGIVIIDPFYSLNSGDENDSRDMTKAMQAFHGLAHATGAAIVYSHHFSKGNQAEKNAIDRGAGSGVMSRSGDTLMSMTPHAQDDTMVLEIANRAFRPNPARCITWHEPVYEVDSGLDPGDLKKPGPAKKPKEDKPKLEAVKAAPRIRTATVEDYEAARAELGPLTRATEAAFAGRLGVSPSTVWLRHRDWRKLEALRGA